MYLIRTMETLWNEEEEEEKTGVNRVRRTRPTYMINVPRER